MSRHTQYDDRAGILLSQIIATCYEISTQTKADAFFSYSPHTSQIDVTIHPKGYSIDDKWDDDGGDVFSLKSVNGNRAIYFGDSEPDDDWLDEEYYKRGIEPLQKAYEQLVALKKQYLEETENEKG